MTTTSEDGHQTPSRAEADIATMAKLFEARTAARSLLGADYPQRIEQWTRFIRVAMEREGVPVLSAALVLAKLTDEAMHHLFLFAAAVEVIEQELR